MHAWRGVAIALASTCWVWIVTSRSHPLTVSRRYLRNYSGCLNSDFDLDFNQIVWLRNYWANPNFCKVEHDENEACKDKSGV